MVILIFSGEFNQKLNTKLKSKSKTRNLKLDNINNIIFFRCNEQLSCTSCINGLMWDLWHVWIFFPWKNERLWCTRRLFEMSRGFTIISSLCKNFEICSKQCSNFVVHFPFRINLSKLTISSSYTWVKLYFGNDFTRKLRK